MLEATVSKQTREIDLPNIKARTSLTSAMRIFFFSFSYRTVHSSSQAVGSGRLQQLPSSSLVESDDRPHVVFADRAVDERGDEDSPQALHAVKVRERLVGEVPGTARGGAVRKADAQNQHPAQIWTNKKFQWKMLR